MTDRPGFFATAAYWDGTVSVDGEYLIQLQTGSYALIDPENLLALQWEYGVDDGEETLPVGELERAQGIQGKYGGVIKRRLVIGDMWESEPREPWHGINIHGECTECDGTDHV